MKLGNKQKLRRFFLKSRKALSWAEVRIKSEKITKRLLNLEEIENKKNILIYLSVDKEVQTREMINVLILKEVNVYVPFYDKKRDRYAICRFTKWTDLEEGPFGILQPKNANDVRADIIDIAIIPGVAFSRFGVRLGYGKGVFDKLLSKSRALKIGLAYDFQVVDRLPAERHDLVMDMVITEKRILELRTS